jgi:hypothetical protein
VQPSSNGPVRRGGRSVQQVFIVPSVTILTPLLVGGGARATIIPRLPQGSHQFDTPGWVDGAIEAPAIYVADIADFSASAPDVAGITFVHNSPELTTISIATERAPVVGEAAATTSRLNTFATSGDGMMRGLPINNTGMSHVFGPVATQGWYEVPA